MKASATGNGTAYAFQTQGSAAPVVDGLAANAAGTGLTAAVYLQHSSAPTMANLVVTSSLDAINANSSGTATFTSLTATASPSVGIGVWARSGTVVVRDSSLSGGNSALRGGAGVLRISNSEMVGVALGSPTCLNTYTPSFAPFTC
jgi:hypothetical protein